MLDPPFLFFFWQERVWSLLHEETIHTEKMRQAVEANGRMMADSAAGNLVCTQLLAKIQKRLKPLGKTMIW